MKKIIKPSDWLLLSLAGLLDFIADIKDPFDLFKNYYQDFYGYVPARWRKENFYHLVWRNLKTGSIKKKKLKRKTYLELTSLGKEKIRRRFPLLSLKMNLKNNSWDGRLRWALYDIEEENKFVREIFRDKIKEFGFGMLQKSVWISPYNFLKQFRQLLEAYNLKEKVILFETNGFYLGDLKKLAKKIWSIDRISLLYKELYKDLLSYKSLIKRGDRNQKLKDLKKQLMKRIIEVYLQDPFLPDEFLPDDWMGEKVRKLAQKMNLF